MNEPLVVARLRAAGCVFAEDEARLLMTAARTPDELDAMVERRVAGLPLEQVLGWAEFCGLRIAVDPGVFVPRRRTEFLVQHAVDLARPGIIVVDLCCGAGAIGAALAAAVDRAEVHAVDIDRAAVRCARRNVPGHVYQGDLYEPLPGRLRGRVGILAVNVPYVPSGQVSLLPAEARAHEPLVALDGGADGLDVLRRVAAGAPAWLAPGGYLLIEISQRQAPQAAAAFSGSGLDPRVVSSAELDATVVIGRLPTSAGGGLGKRGFLRKLSPVGPKTRRAEPGRGLLPPRLPTPKQFSLLVDGGPADAVHEPHGPPRAGRRGTHARLRRACLHRDRGDPRACCCRDRRAQARASGPALA